MYERATFFRRKSMWLAIGLSLALWLCLMLVPGLISALSVPLLAGLWVAPLLLILLALGAAFLRFQWRHFTQERGQDRALMRQEEEKQADALDLAALSCSFQHSLTQACGGQVALLLVRHEDSGLYRFVVPPTPEERACVEGVLNSPGFQCYPAPPTEEWSLAPAVIERFIQTSRPLFAQELQTAQPVGYTTEDASLSATLLVPLVASGELFGLALLGPREGQQPVVDTIFEEILQICVHFLPLLTASARHAAQREHTHTLEGLLHFTTLIPITSMNAFATKLVEVSALSAPMQAEFWEVRETTWHQLALAGNYPHALSSDQMRQILSQRAWQDGALFVEKGPNARQDSFALLPLKTAGHVLGCLVFQYHRPRHFSMERRHLLKLAAIHLTGMFQAAQTMTTMPGPLAPDALEGEACPAPQELVEAFQELTEAMIPLLHQPVSSEYEGNENAGRSGPKNERQWRDLQRRWASVQMLASHWFLSSMAGMCRGIEPSLPSILIPAEKELVLVVRHPHFARMIETALADLSSRLVVCDTICQALQRIQQHTETLGVLIIDDEALSISPHFCCMRWRNMCQYARLLSY